jgi:hypothetical protein
MKRKSFYSFAVAFVLSIMAIPVLSQTAKDVFNTQTPIFYYGIDFTKAKLINDAEANEHDIKERQFDGINDLMVNEPKKYDFAGALRRSELPNDLGFAAKRNATIDPDNIKSTSSADYNRLKESDIQEVVKAFDFGNNKGIGLLIVMEGMSKSKKGASMWITFVDISTKKVLFTERMEGKGGMAFGFRNYWAVPIRDVVDEIKKKKYTEWKSKYGG